MKTWGQFVEEQIAAGADAASDVERPCVGSYGDVAAEYRALAAGPALVDRTCRGLLEVHGADRVSWLHNLTTNDVEDLPAGDGQYAFALNVQGRILFDLNILVQQESIWLDVDRRWVGFVRGHFEKYIITEDVSILDRSGEFVRIGLAGEAAKGILSDLGVGHAPTMPWLGTTVMRWDDGAVPLIRHDFCGTLALEMLVPAAKAVALWEVLSDSSRPAHAVPVGQDAVQIRRIEVGLPWPFCEITGEYLPAETGQLDRAVSFTKGCYLGQEVVERMRSRDAVARQLVSVKLEGDAVPPAGTTLQDDRDREVGRVTSACRSPAFNSVIGLAYIKTASAEPGTTFRARWADYSLDATITAAR